jgi:type II secretory pathway pseudopilin PulG
MRKQIYRQISNFLANKKLVRGFTITELLVAIGLLVAVLAASTTVFHYSIEAQRTAMATSEIMHSLRAITDQLNANFAGLRKDGYLVLRSSSDANDAVYFFSTGDFESWTTPGTRSNTARIYFGPAKTPKTDLAMDIKLLTPGKSGRDYNDANFAACQSNITANYEDPCNVLSAGRPTIDINNNSNDVRMLLAQNIGSMRIEWAYDKSPIDPNQTINWYGIDKYLPGSQAFEVEDDPYFAAWTPSNSTDWPKALKFTFTLYDSKKILKTGRQFEHIVYIGN